MKKDRGDGKAAVILFASTNAISPRVSASEIKIFRKPELIDRIEIAKSY
jgi:hypothetical protein